MHIPDGFIPLWQCAIYGIIVLISWIFTLRWLIKTLEKDKIDILKIFLFIFLVGFVFLIQAFNIPVLYGGVHLLGAALVAILIGSPWAAVLLISIVLIIQGLFFGDGGLLTLGANIFNIGIMGGFVGFYIYKASKRLGKIPSTLVGGFLAGWGSVFAVGLACTIELGLTGLFPLYKAISTMGIYFAIAGIMEGFMTMAGCVTVLILRSHIKKEGKNTQKGQVS